VSVFVYASHKRLGTYQEHRRGELGFCLDLGDGVRGNLPRCRLDLQEAGVRDNLTVSPGARKEGRALGAGSLYLRTAKKRSSRKLRGQKERAGEKKDVNACVHETGPALTELD
jgi:hypothetical protein